MKTTTKATKAPKAVAPVALKPVITGPLKPIKTRFNKLGPLAHQAAVASVEAKAVEVVFAALEATIASIDLEVGLAGHFTLPCLFEVTSMQVPPKQARVGIDPSRGKSATLPPSPRPPISRSVR